jgi:hypothetical protein
MLFVGIRFFEHVWDCPVKLSKVKNWYVLCIRGYITLAQSTSTEKFEEFAYVTAGRVRLSEAEYPFLTNSTKNPTTLWLCLVTRL